MSETASDAIRAATWADREAVAALRRAWTGQGFVRVVLSPSTRSVSFYARGGFEPATSLMVRETRTGS